MAYAIVHTFPGGTQEQYEASIAAVHPDAGRSLPDGMTLHVAGPSADGWTIVAICSTQEAWEAFRDGTLLPALGAGIEGAFTAPPQEITFPVANEQTA